MTSYITSEKPPLHLDRLIYGVLTFSGFVAVAEVRQTTIIAKFDVSLLSNRLCVEKIRLTFLQKYILLNWSIINICRDHNTFHQCLVNFDKELSILYSKYDNMQFIYSPLITLHLLNIFPIYIREVRLGYYFTPYQRLWLYNGAPLVAFYDTLGILRMYSRLKPPAPSRGKVLFYFTFSWIKQILPTK